MPESSPSSASTFGRSSLDPALLARLANLPLRARAVVDGVLAGLHRSPRHGQAIEFAQHKEYAPGDDPRHIDWRACARVDKHYVKKYQLETHLRAWVVLDCSGSMAYGSTRRKGLTKLAYGQLLAATLAHLLVRQQDLCGLVLSAGPDAEAPAASLLGERPLRMADGDALVPGVLAQLPPRSSESHLAALMQALEVEAAGSGGLVPALSFVAEKAQSRPIVFVVSDLLDVDASALAASVALLRRRGCDVVCLHLMDEDELTFPFDDTTEFFALEGPLRLEAHPEAVRAGYLEELRRFLDERRELWRAGGAEYVLASTAQPLDALLVPLLAGRQGAGRGR